MFLELLLVFFAIFIIVFVNITDQNPRPIFAIYQQPNGYFWFKTLCMYVLLSFKKFFYNLKLSFESETQKLERYADLERPHKLSDHEQPVDAVYFNAASAEGDHLVLGMSRRKAGLIDGFLFLKLEASGLGILESPKLPDTSLYQDEPKEEFAAEEIKVECIEPMKRWKIYYDGKMKVRSNNDIVWYNVKLNIDYTSDLPFFNFKDDMDPFFMAQNIATEKWSKDYFRILKEKHQTHYEQHGDLTGKAEIDGKSYEIKMNTMRDHSFGYQRKWADLHRYILHFFTAENGDRFTVGFVCMPVLFSGFIMGFVVRAEDKSVHPIRYSDFKLYQHGENGIVSKDYAFSIEAGGKLYVIEVDVKDTPTFYMSKDWETKLYEGFSRFKINGMKGWGSAEWEYRHMEGRKAEKAT